MDGRTTTVSGEKGSRAEERRFRVLPALAFWIPDLLLPDLERRFHVDLFGRARWSCVDPRAKMLSAS
jgi:hypothetical protein